MEELKKLKVDAGAGEVEWQNVVSDAQLSVLPIVSLYLLSTLLPIVRCPRHLLLLHRPPVLPPSRPLEMPMAQLHE